MHTESLNENISYTLSLYTIFKDIKKAAGQMRAEITADWSKNRLRSLVIPESDQDGAC